MSFNDMVKQTVSENMNPHIMVSARAGTGKTFTLVLGVAWAWKDKVWKDVERKLGKIEPSEEQQAVWDSIGITHPKTVTYVAFNNSIVKEFEQKWNWMAQMLERVGCNLQFSTIHSLGYQACKKEYKLGWKAVNKWTTHDNLCELLSMDIKELRKHHRELLNSTVDIVSKIKLNMVNDMSDENLYKLINHYGIDTGGEDKKVFGLARDLVEWAAHRKGSHQINFDDQIWLPSINNLPVRKSELMLVDESQDLNACQQALVKRAGERLVFCGDPFQAIYGFAGADTESMNNLRTYLEKTSNGVDTLTLTQTRRCGKAIVARAQQIVEDFTAHESCPEGKVRELKSDEAFAEYAADDLVVCRTNAPLLGQAFRMLKEKRPAKMQGRDQLAGKLKTLIKKSQAKYPEDLILWAGDWEQKEVSKVKRRKHYDEESIMAIVDQADCLRMLGEEADDMQQLETLLQQVFYFEPPVTLFSSIHRAKGLEARRVYLLRPDLLPHPMAETEWAKEQERNLEYVAGTRAIEELILVRKEG